MRSHSRFFAAGALLAASPLVASAPLNDTLSSVPVLNATAIASSAAVASSVIVSQASSVLASATSAVIPQAASSVEASPSATATSASEASASGVVITVTLTSTSYPAAQPTYSAFSPPKYPTPEVRGEGTWAEAVEKAKAKVSTWTLEQKVNVTTGVGWYGGRCVGNIAAQPELDFPGLCLQDSPLGVRFADFVTAFPAGINAASTFDRDLIRKRGLAMGREFRAKGVHVALSPMMNLGRVAAGGRNWEGFGADPYLTGEAAYETIKGMQTKGEGVQACMKHFIANEEERNRTETSSNINDRTMHELYLHPFLKSVMADVTSAMCAYNLVNNSWSCQNSAIQNELLKDELGFQGYIMSDWAATESGVGSALAGLDMTMPGDVTFSSGDSYFGKNLTMSVNNGSVPISRVDDMATRILAGFYFMEQDDPSYPEVNFDFRNVNNPETNSHVDVQADHHKIVREMGAASTVLLKNVNGALPLVAPRSIAVIGNDAGPARLGPNGYPDHGGLDGVLGQGWGSGTADYSYLIDPLSAIQVKARENRTSVSWVLDNYANASIDSTASFKDVALVFIASDSGEQYITVDGNEGDRNNLTAWHAGDALVERVASKNNNTIVILHSVGPVLLESWIENPNVTAVLYAGLPGQEAGNSIVDILWGAYNPSARLPFTIAKQREDYPADIVYQDTLEPLHRQIDYTEELEIDYRHFQSKNIEPRFGFGFGLSYTSFGYSNLKVASTPNSKRHLDEQKEYQQSTFANRKVGSSTSASLHAQQYSISFDLTNTGDVNGCDVPQLYLKFPEAAGEPPRVLRGFERINLDPGATKTVTFPLSLYEMSIWDVISQRWVRPEGEFGIIVGQNAFDTQLEGTISA